MGLAAVVAAAAASEYELELDLARRENLILRRFLAPNPEALNAARRAVQEIRDDCNGRGNSRRMNIQALLEGSSAA